MRRPASLTPPDPLTGRRAAKALPKALPFRTTKRGLVGPEPKAAGRNNWDLIEYLQRDALFVRDHETKRLAWIAGDRKVIFPYGTWLMRRRYNVRCAQAPP